MELDDSIKGTVQVRANRSDRELDIDRTSAHDSFGCYSEVTLNKRQYHNDKHWR